MARPFTCKDCAGTFEAVSNTGRLPSRCETCRPKHKPRDIADISSIFSSSAMARTEGVRTVRKPTTASTQHSERALTALAMRRDRKTWEQIAEACGYASRGAAYTAAKAEMTRRQAEINETIDDIRQAELAHLEMLSDKALEIMHKAHLHVSAGTVTHYKGEPLIDDGPTMSAVDRLVKISESRRKLLGLDAATKAETAVQVQFTVQGIAEGEMP